MPITKQPRGAFAAATALSPDSQAQPLLELQKLAARPDTSHTSMVRDLFHVHNKTLVGFLMARLGSRAEARDVAQEAYARLLQLENPGAVAFLRSYLFRIASNLAIDHLRQRRVRKDETPQQVFEQWLSRPSPERAVLAEQQLDMIVAALEELPEKCRQAFALHYFDDRSLQDIATMMGLSNRMVQKYVARALECCRARLDEVTTSEDRAGTRR